MRGRERVTLGLVLGAAVTGLETADEVQAAALRQLTLGLGIEGIAGLLALAYGDAGTPRVVPLPTTLPGSQPTDLEGLLAHLRARAEQAAAQAPRRHPVARPHLRQHRIGQARIALDRPGGYCASTASATTSLMRWHADCSTPRSASSRIASTSCGRSSARARSNVKDSNASGFGSSHTPAFTTTPKLDWLNSPSI